MNFDLKVASEKRILKLDEMEEFHNDVYEIGKIYMEQTKKWHDKMILRCDFVLGQQNFLFNSPLKLFPSQSKLRWLGPFIVQKVVPFGTIELKIEDGSIFCVNGPRLKHYYGDEERNLQNILL